MTVSENKKLAEIYKTLAEQYLIEKYSVRELDERFGECKAGFIPEENRIDNGLKYISILNETHMERLETEQIQDFRNLLDLKNVDDRLIGLIRDTYRQVMIADGRPNVYFEFFKDIHGDGIFPGNAIIFCFIDQTKYGEDRKIDWEAEEYKNKVFRRVKQQFEQLAGREKDNPVFLIRKQVERLEI